MAHIHRIGEPANPSEARAIRALGERLPADWLVVHNFEVPNGRGLPYEFDVVVIADFGLWHLEVKGYGGEIRGDARQWVFENGAVQPSPIPLANKKSKVLAGKLERHSRALREVFVDTRILLTDDRADVKLRDDQAFRVIRLADAEDHLTNPARMSARTGDIRRLHDPICEALFGFGPRRKVSRIGLYDILERINQTEARTVFLAAHRHIRTRPKTILKVHHFDVYEADEEKARRIEAIFHDQEAMRVLGAHPNLIETYDMFAWEDDAFVLPTEYLEGGRPLETLLAREEDRALSWADKADIVAKVARGLRYAHSRGVVHRDIRPLNVVVAPGGIVKLVNFDLALFEGAPSLSFPRGLADRLDPRYVAPEVWLDPAAATRRSDVYSLGVVFYELLTGRRPYEHVDDVIDGGGDPPLDEEILLAELATPGNDDFMRSPEDAAAVIVRMCRADPSRRPASMDEVIEDLAILSGE